MIGQTLSHYKIVAEIGRGGMGIVYKADDMKLDRLVAIKVLPPHALTSEDDRARFYREARAAAQLNHANICHVYQIDEAVLREEDESGDFKGDDKGGEQRLFIAMEYIDGETLQDRINKRPLKLQDCIRIATQVAEALKEAHNKGVVHRDIKSSNVMLDDHGNAKVLDFGLAKTAHSTLLTKMGSTLGTIAFMSPEQARGEEVDLRTDLWALGVMIYEMVSGNPPFGGDYEQAVVYSILNEEPEPLTAMRTGVPMDLEWIVNKCMAKSADHRYQSAADLVVDLANVKVDAPSQRHSTPSTPSIPARSAPSRPETGSTMSAVSSRDVPTRLLLAVIVATAAISIFVSWLVIRPSGTATFGDFPVVQSEIHLNENRIPRALSISPDGKLLAYSETDQGVVYIRDLATGEEWQVPDTEDVIELDFSPDGEWLLLDQQNAILRAPIRGGSPVLLTTVARDAPHSSWAPDNAILYDDVGSIFRLSLDDGSIAPIASANTSDGELRLLWGKATPDGSLFFARVIKEPTDDVLAIFSYPDGERIRTDSWNAVGATYLETGHLLALEEGDLMARPFDIQSGQMAGPPVRIAESIGESSWSISARGQLVTAPITSFQFTSTAINAPPVELHRLQPGTSPIALDFPIERYANFSVGPNKSRIAVEIRNSGGTGGDVWILYPENGVSEQLTFDGTGNDPAWTPDGDSLLVVQRFVDISELHVIAADGSGLRRVMLADSLRLGSPDWSRQTNKIAVDRLMAETSQDIFLLNPTSGVIESAVVGTGAQSKAKFSPNGAFFVFGSDQTVFVRSTELDGSEWNVSQGPGENPQWSADGRAIYFVRSGALLRVPVETEGSFRRRGNPEVIYESSGSVLPFATYPGTDELLIGISNVDRVSSNQITVKLVSNIISEIERLAPHENR